MSSPRQTMSRGSFHAPGHGLLGGSAPRESYTPTRDRPRSDPAARRPGRRRVPRRHRAAHHGRGAARDPRRPRRLDGAAPGVLDHQRLRASPTSPRCRWPAARPTARPAVASSCSPCVVFAIGSVLSGAGADARPADRGARRAGHRRRAPSCRSPRPAPATSMRDRPVREPSGSSGAFTFLGMALGPFLGASCSRPSSSVRPWRRPGSPTRPSPRSRSRVALGLLHRRAAGDPRARLHLGRGPGLAERDRALPDSTSSVPGSSRRPWPPACWPSPASARTTARSRPRCSSRSRRWC